MGFNQGEWEGRVLSQGRVIGLAAQNLNGIGLDGTLSDF
jgi:hypothetical protein